MAEYIEREALVRQIICNMAEFIGAPDDVQRHDEYCNYVINIIEDAPAADVVPVWHGRWIPAVHVGDCCYRCSECQFLRDAYLIDIGNYCPNCGAKMDLE